MATRQIRWQAIIAVWVRLCIKRVIVVASPLFLLVSPIRSYAITEDELKGKTLIFAETITKTSKITELRRKHTTNIYLRIGHYDFGSSTSSVQVSYFLFDAAKNRPTWPHEFIDIPNIGRASRYRPVKFPLPAYEDRNEQPFKGRWEVDGPFIRVTILDTVHEWRQDQADPTLFTPSKPFFNATNGSHVIGDETFYNNFGYAYLTENYKVRGVAINDSHLHPTYTETGYHHDGNQVLTSGWDFYGSEGWGESFNKSSPGQNRTLLARWLKQPEDWDDGGFILLNDAPHSNLIIYQLYGNDFNNNRYLDEGGHVNMVWGVWNPLTSKVDRAVGVQYAYQNAKKPLLSVFKLVPRP
jgi:hypothetical protein